jgi:hypothetical protein
VGIGLGANFLSGFLPRAGAEELFVELDRPAAGVFAPTGRGTMAPGGFCLSGRWAFASGCQHAAVQGSGMFAFDGDGAMELDPTGAPVLRLAFVPTAAVDVSRPIVFATLIVMAVFVPLVMMTGIEGRMYQPLALAVIATVGAALLLALTLVPLAAVYTLRGQGAADHEPRLIRWVKQQYAPLLDWCLARAGRVRVSQRCAILAFYPRTVRRQ